MCGVRNNYDVKDAMLTNSLFKDFLDENGLDVYKEKSTRDIICVEFNYGSRSYQEEQKNCKKIIKATEAELADTDDEYLTVKLNEKLKRLNDLLESTNNNQDKYKKMSKQDIRVLFYNNGVTIRYPVFGRDKKIKSFDEIHYKMLYRTPGKAKKGSCMFIRDSLYDKAREFLYMGIKLPEKNAPIVEIGAYSSLITSSIVGRVQIRPEEIFIFKEDSFDFKTDVINVGAKNRQCFARFEKDYTLSNNIFDGQALIDSSIFPEDGNGYILLRQHFFKAAAFKTNIQTFFKDYYGEKYDTAVITDMFGVEHRVKDIKLITTNNACKWIKFDGITFDYWCEWLSNNDYKFGIVKTAHESKFGDVQRMSYQMINALDEKTIDSVLSKSKEYIKALKTDDEAFFQYLKDNINFSNDFEALLAICKKCPDFVRSDYFRERKKNIIYSYVLNLKNGKVIQNADNLTIVGSPYAMLLNTVGEDPHKDPTFTHEDEAIQCWTARFDDGEYLAEFRNPFNSRNNLGYLHNVYHEYFDKYFDFGKLIIAVNSLGSFFMDRNNGSDFDSDSIYTTNQPDIVAHAKYCVVNYPTIVNTISKDTNKYNNTMNDFAEIDNKLAASQLSIGESSNLAQLCLTYTYNFDDQKYSDYACILSVIAQAAIDNSKRTYDINIDSEIKRIKQDMNVSRNRYPAFWLGIRKGFNIDNINWNLSCPMNHIYKYKPAEYKPDENTIPIGNFFVNHKLIGSKKLAKKVQHLIEDYSLELFTSNLDDNTGYEDYILLRNDFDDIVNEIRSISLSDKYIGIISWLLNRGLGITPQVNNKYNKNKMNSTINKNKVILLKILYDANPEMFLKCFESQKSKDTPNVFDDCQVAQIKG